MLLDFFFFFSFFFAASVFYLTPLFLLFFAVLLSRGSVAVSHAVWSRGLSRPGVRVMGGVLRSFQSSSSVASERLLRTYLRSEVASHNSDEDLWVIIDNHVYDLTEWANFHPGSRQVLVEFAGKDATEYFSEVGHSDYARAKMGQFLIGKVDVSPRFTGSEYRSRVGEV